MKPESSHRPPPPEVEEWLSKQPDLDRRALEESWRLAEHGLPPMTSSDHGRKQEVWAAVSASTRRHGDRGEMPRPRLHLVSSVSWRWAAAAAVALLLCAAYLLRPITIEAPYGAMVEATLPDGSTVELNSGSTLVHRAHFLGTRTITLEGEAFFDVVEDSRPFAVETANARTTVLGTEFNVRARHDDARSSTHVVVASGQVEVASRLAGGDAVVLRRGEGSSVLSSKRPSAPAEVVVERELAWRSGGIAFSDVPFSTIFAEVERRYDVEIHAPIDIQNAHYAIWLHEPRSAEEVLTTLTQANGFRYRETAKGFEIYRP